MVAAFNWHSGKIDRDTLITPSYRGTQEVRQFFRAECGYHFTFDRSFIAWMRQATGKTMGDAVDEWLRRKAEGRQPHPRDGRFNEMKRWQTLDDSFHAADVARLDAQPGGLWDAIWARKGVPEVLATCRTLKDLEALVADRSFRDTGAPCEVPAGLMVTHDPMSIRRRADCNGDRILLARRRLP